MMRSLFNLFGSIPKFMLLYACLKAILVPMYTVVFLVNDWTYSHPLIENYIQWHQFEMIFSFFVAVLISFEFFYSSVENNKTKESLFIAFNLSLVLIDHVLWLGEIGRTLFGGMNALFILLFIKVIPQCLSLKQFLIRRLPLKILLILKIAVFQALILSDDELFRLMMQISFASITWYMLGIVWSQKLYSVDHKWFKYHFIFNLGLCSVGAGWYLFNVVTSPTYNMAYGGIHFFLALGISSVVINLMIRIGLQLSSMPLKLNWKLSFMLLTLLLGGLIRSLGPEIYFDSYFLILHHAMGFWTLAFIFYFFYFARKFVKSHKIPS